MGFHSLRCALPLALVAGLAAGQAMAQQAWPTDKQPPAGGAMSWPTDGRSAPPGASPAPVAAGPPPAQAPMTPMAPMSPMMSPMGAPQGAPPPEVQACLAEFTKLRGETEKRSAAAKAGGEAKADRETMCKLVTNLVSAETKWVTFVEHNFSKCGIPAEIVKQLKGGHANLSKVRQNICNGGGGAPAAAGPPSLSEAFGTANLPIAGTTPAKKGGALDTMTGTPIR